MTSVFLYHVVGDLTVGKPELSEFLETQTVAAAIEIIGDTSEGGIPVWKQKCGAELESRQRRFVGILNALDIVAFLARDDSLADLDKAINTPVSHLLVPNNSALKVVDPATRLIDALEMMRQGVQRLVVPKSLVWRGISKRFSILYNGKWLRNNVDPCGSNSTNSLPKPSSSTSPIQDKFCCLTREDVLRFLIGCLGALAPLPLSSIASLGAINPNYQCIEASVPAIDATKKLLPVDDPSAVAVVEPTIDGHHKIIGEISCAKLWKCDYLGAAWGLANLSAGQFVMGVDEFMNADYNNNRVMRKLGKYGRSMYRGRSASAPLTCRATTSLAAVMAQMLSHRATHVWVTNTRNQSEEDDEYLVGVVGYRDILAAVTTQPPSS